MTIQLIRNLGVALLAAASVYAQGSPRLIAQIPFGFHVGNSMLPSGEYTVDTDAGPGVLRLRSADCKSSVMILSNAVLSRDASSQGKLIFSRYGDRYFLSQVWNAGSNTGRELRKSHSEREVAANPQQGVETIVAKR